MNIDVIILAGGSSSRMTGHKQLLLYNGQTLIKHLCDLLATLNVRNIYCITGLLDTELRNELKNANIKCIHNPEHEIGMVSTLKVGIRQILDKASDAVLVCLTDQPLIPKNHYQELIAKARKTNNSIISSGYNDTVGPPVIFKSDHFQSILNLPKGKSTKSLIKKNLEHTLVIDCAEASKDIDTDEDYQALISK